MGVNLSAYQGCLLGLAVGDAMGYIVDGKSWNAICADYGPNGLLGYDLVNGYAEVTSYTQLAAYTANGLLLALTRRQPNAYLRYIAAALREWSQCQKLRRVPDGTLCWISHIPALRRRSCMDTRMPDVLDKQTMGAPESPVNQSVSPAALTAAAMAGLFFDPGRMEPMQIGRLGAGIVALVHGSPEAFLSGAVLAYSIAGILQAPDHPLNEQFLQACDTAKAQFGKQYPQILPLCARIEQAVALAGDPQQEPRQAMEDLGCRTAPECLAGAVYASLVNPDDFDAGMILAVNHSGRSAAVGAVTGAILGAKLGIEFLPEFYLDSLEPQFVLRQLAEDLAQDRVSARLFDDDWDQKYVQGRPVEIG